MAKCHGYKATYNDVHGHVITLIACHKIELVNIEAKCDHSRMEALKIKQQLKNSRRILIVTCRTEVIVTT